MVMVINDYPIGIVNYNDETFTIKRVLGALNKLNPTFFLPLIQKDDLAFLNIIWLN